MMKPSPAGASYARTIQTAASSPHVGLLDLREVDAAVKTTRPNETVSYG